MDLYQKPTTKSIYFWNIMGSFSNALLSVIVLMVITRTMSPVNSDIFSLAWSISQLMATIGTFQIRTYQATDVTGKFSFKQYLNFRFVCLIFMMVISILYIVFLNFDFYKSFVILLICIFRAVDCLADVYEGWFQQKERLDLSGKAQTARIIFCILFLFISCLITKNLIYICVSLILSYSICFYFFDFTVYKKFFRSDQSKEKFDNWNIWLKKILKETIPLFFNSFLAMAITNIPKMSIDSSIDQSLLSNGSQAIYNVIFMPASFLTLAYIVFRPLVTKMAILWQEGEYRKYFLILIRIFSILMFFCIPIIFAANWIGCPVLSFFYGLDLSNQNWNLTIILIGGCFYTFSCILDNALVVMRKQYTLIIAYILAAVTCWLFSDTLVFMYGITGASLVYLISMIIFFITMLILFILGYFHSIKNKTNVKIREEKRI